MLLSCMHLKPSQSWAVISSCFPSWLPRTYGNDHRNRSRRCFLFEIILALSSVPDLRLFRRTFLYSANKGNARRHPPLYSYLYCGQNRPCGLYPVCWLALTLRPDLPLKFLLLRSLLYPLHPRRIPEVPVRICSVLLHRSSSE